MVKHAVYIIAALVALAEWLYGMSIPLDFRVRGDAATYLATAQGFASLWQAFTHVGARANGLPLLEYALQGSPTAICLFMFAVHGAASLVLCRMVTRRGWIPANWQPALFALLVCFPPMVFHTTTPLADTFGADVIIIAFCALASGRWLGTAIGGLLLGYAITVRPAYIPGIAAFLVVWACRRSLRPFLAVACCLLYLAPTVIQCHEQYGSWSMQAPGLFDANLSMRSGIKGTQIPWWRSDLYASENIPTVPDPFMVGHFYHRCDVASVGDLASCLAGDPAASVVLVGKKLGGLHDYFRLTPYTEQMTPDGWIVAGRASGWIAIAGLAALLLGGATLLFRRRLGRWEIALLAFVVLQVASHLALHVEERYSLAWVPYCLAALVAVAALIVRARKRS